ncbi:MAG: hypothetical protein KDE34_29290, partial [Anaerolineales bacterium]|nr:hypothetical protein [Anaerolineales bacterium]
MKVRYFGLLWLGVLGLFLLVACGGGDQAESAGTDTPILVLPTLEPVELSGAPLKVVATTSIIGDVVGQVG